MTMPTRSLLLILACAAIAGCHATPRSSADESRDICLADPGAGSPIDEAIRHAQGQARKLPIEPHSWTLVGQGWVRKARVTSDPGFYVSVRSCADKEPNDTIALGFLSDALLELGEFDRAAAATQRMVDLQPDMASYSRAAYFRWLAGDSVNAKLFMRYALNGRDIKDKEPTAWTFVQAATMYWNEGDYDGADAVFAEALKWVPDYAPALTGRARVHMSLGQPKRAVEYLEKAFKINRLPETAWLLGDARAMLGDAAGAQAAYDLVVREGRKADRLTLALFFATKNRDTDEAVRLLEEERRTRGGVYVDDAYAWALYRAGRIDEARTASDRALRLHTNDARLLYHGGMIRLSAGDRSGRDLIRRALQLNPKFDADAAAEAARILMNG